MNKYRTLFEDRKPILAMLHLGEMEGRSMMETAKREIEIYYQNGVDAVLVENYFGSAGDCQVVLEYLQKNYPERIYGVNILGDHRRAFALAETYNARFIQIDSVCGHYPPTLDALYGEEVEQLCKNSRAAVLGGVRFKYQPVCSGRTVEEDLTIAQSRCDAVVVTGEGTGLNTPDVKIREFGAALGEFPLVTGAGVTIETARATLELCDGLIVGSWLKEGHRDCAPVSEKNVRRFVAAVRDPAVNDKNV